MCLFRYFHWSLLFLSESCYCFIVLKVFNFYTCNQKHSLFFWNNQAINLTNNHSFFILATKQCVKGTPLWSGRVTHLKGKNQKPVFFLLLTCVVIAVLPCCTLICLLSVGNLFKTCIISVEQGKTFKRFSLFNRYISILNRVAKSIEKILLRNHKISSDTQK